MKIEHKQCPYCGDPEPITREELSGFFEELERKHEQFAAAVLANIRALTDRVTEARFHDTERLNRTIQRVTQLERTRPAPPPTEPSPPPGMDLA